MQNEHYHHLFTNVDRNQIDLIKEEIKKSPFLDIVLEFDDFEEINKLINSIPDHHTNKEIIKECMIRDYLYFKIIEKANLEEYNIYELRQKLYSGDFEKYRDMDVLMWMYIDDELKEAAELTEGKKARCHFFLDSVKDKNLQYEINSLYASRTNAVLMGYTTKNMLPTYASSFGDFIEDPHDLKLKY